MESIYWVLSRDCNQRCAHCYNDSKPGAPGLARDEVSRCVDHLPDPADVPVERIILSGGEPLVWPELLFHALDALWERYAAGTLLCVQTNGDSLDAAMLDALGAHHVRRVDVASMDAFHHKRCLQRRDGLEALLVSRGFEASPLAPSAESRRAHPELPEKTYSFWGASPGTWIGPLWPRGRAQKNGLTKAGPEDRFCAGWSGARGFLDYRAQGSEVNIQLADLYPCCPMTAAPAGNLLDEPLLTILDRLAEEPVFQKLNEGNPEAMGETLGIDAAHGVARSQELGNHCRWCDEFFTRHAPTLLRQDSITTRGSVDLPPRKTARRPNQPGNR